MKFSQYTFTFLMGYFIYSLLEILCRGYTHWTMALTGGTILTLFYIINTHHTLNLIKNCFIGCIIITTAELLVGIFDNIIMNWNVWDYSEMPFNFMGQICLFFSCMWFLISIPAYYVCKGIYKRFNS